MLPPPDSSTLADPSGRLLAPWRDRSHLRRGFTVVELLATVSVVGVVAGFVLLKAHGTVDEAHIAGMKNDLHNYANLQAGFGAETGAFADGPGEMEGFTFSPDVVEHDHHTQAGRYYMAVTHRQVDHYCWLKYGVATLDNGKIRCGETPPGSPAPEASFEVTGTAVMSYMTLGLDASGSFDGDGAITSYDWDFGDGTTGTGVTPGKIYPDSGQYTVRLEVTDDEGWTGVVEKQLYVTKQWLISPQNYGADMWEKVNGVDVSPDGHTVTFQSSSSRLRQAIDVQPDPEENGNSWEVFTLSSDYQIFRIARTSGGDTSIFEVKARGVPGTQIKMLSDWNKDCFSCALEKLQVQIAPHSGATGTPIDIEYAIAYFI